MNPRRFKTPDIKTLESSPTQNLLGRKRFASVLERNTARIANIAFRQTLSGDGPWHGQDVVGFRPTLDGAWLNAVRTVTDAVRGDCGEQGGKALHASDVHQKSFFAKRLDGLQRALEANLSRCQMLMLGRHGHHPPQHVVGDQVNAT